VHRQLRRDTDFPLIFVRYNPKDYAFLCTDKLPRYDQFFFRFSECSLRTFNKNERQKKPTRARETPKVSRGQWIYARWTGFAFRILERRW
jgi:hypothetical protein